MRTIDWWVSILVRMRKHVYTHGHAEAVLRSHEWRTVENSAAYVMPILDADHVILDLGTGPGTIGLDLASRVKHVTLTEISDEALGLSQKLAQERGTQNVAFQVEDIHVLSFDDDTFDMVHAHQVLQHVADPVQALREMARVTKPGGWVAVRDADYRAFTWYPEAPALDRWLDLYSRAARANGGQPDAGRRLLAWAHAAELMAAKPSSSTWCYATSESRTWWAGLWADRVTKTALANQLIQQGLADEKELRDIAEGWRAWARNGDGWFSVLHGEILWRKPVR